MFDLTRSIINPRPDGYGSRFVVHSLTLGRVSTRKNQLLQNQLSSSVACTPTCKNLLVQISQLNSSSMLQKTALNSDRKPAANINQFVIQSSN